MVKRKAEDVANSAATSGDNNGSDDEESFPRGGGSILSDLEKKEIHQAATEDFEREQKKKRKQLGKERKSSKDANLKKKRKVDAASDKDAQQELFAGKTPKSVGVLTFKALSPGFKLLGVVIEVTPSDVIISLPNGLRAYAKTRSKKTDKAKSWQLKNGQLVVCVVISLKSGPNKHRINVSCDPAIVNKGLTESYLAKGLVIPVMVSSHEDHGYIVDAGPSGKHFIPKEKLKADQLDVEEGSIRLCNVTFVNLNKKAVGLEFVSESSFPDVAPPSSNMNLTLQSLQPGTPVAGEIKQVLRDGLMIQFFTYFTGYCDRWHLGADIFASDALSKFKVNDKVQARVLHVDNTKKRVGLSMNPSLLHLKRPDAAPKFGQVLDSKIERIDDNAGVLLALTVAKTATQELESSPSLSSPPSQNGGSATILPAFCNASDASDAKSASKLSKQFQVGQTVKARVVGDRALDGVVMVSLKTSVVNQPIFDISECYPGQPMSLKIVKVEDTLLSMSVTESVKAVCRLAHMAEMPIIKTPKKFKAGQEVKCRVLKVDQARKRIYVTLKRTLVNSKLPCISTFDDAQEGVKVHGFICSIESYGLFVEFYGGIRGLIHKSNLGMASSESIDTVFTVGQVVKCVVVGLDQVKRQINLSLNISKNSAESSSFKKTALGMKVSCTIQSKTATGVVVVVDKHSSSSSSQSTETSDAGLKQQAFIPKEHLSDFASLNERILEALEQGSTLDEIMVLAKNDKSKTLLLSAKTSLVALADDRQKLPQDISTISEGHLLSGYVASVTKGAVFVRFLGKFTALAPLSQLTDSYVSDPGQHFKVGQSVKALVTSIDEATSRCTVSLKPSLCGSENGQAGLRYFSTISRVLRLKGLDEAKAPAIAQIVTGSVSEVKDYGLIVEIDDFEGVVGFVISHQITGKTKPQVGDKVTGSVLDVSYVEGIVDLSLKVKDDAEPNPKKTKKTKKKKDSNTKLSSHECMIQDESTTTSSVRFRQGQKVDAVIELVKEDYLVVSVSQPSNCIGFIVNMDTNTAFKNIHDSFKIGMSLKPCFHGTCQNEYMSRHVFSLDLTTKEESQKTASPASGGRSATGLKGSIVTGRITNVRPLFAQVETDSGLLGQVHVTSMNLPLHIGQLPLESLDKDKDMEFKVLGEIQAAREEGASGQEKTRQLLLSIMPQKSGLHDEHVDYYRPPKLDDISDGSQVVGVISKIDADFMLVQLSRGLRGSLSVFELSTDLDKVLERRSLRYNSVTVLELCS